MKLACSIRNQQILHRVFGHQSLSEMHVVKNLPLPSWSSLGRFHRLNWIWPQRFSLTLQGWAENKRCEIPVKLGSLFGKSHLKKAAFNLLFLTDFRRTAWSSAMTLSMLAASAPFWRGFLRFILLVTIVCGEQTTWNDIDEYRIAICSVVALQGPKICSKTVEEDAWEFFPCC